MNQTLINLALALATNELLHNIFEIKNIREKVKRLVAYMDKKPYKELPLNIDTRAKSYAVALIAFMVFTLPLFGIYTLLNINADTAIKLIVGLLVASFVLTGYFVDQYHVDIEKVTKRFKK